ncbi:MAG: DNA-methyltransferase [Thermodesulfobacteriota bacterium]
MKLPAKYKNSVLNRDVIEVLKELPDNCLNMVYGDPDYNVGIKYAGGQKHRKAWNSYIDWYSELAKESLRVLKPTGNLFLLNYPKQNAYLRVNFLDETAFDVQDYAWVYNTNVGHSNKRFTTAHRSILHATKTAKSHFYKDQVAEPYQNPEDRRIKQRIAEGHKGRMPYSWFYFDLVKNVSKDKTFHSCQIPVPLVEMLIKSCTKKNDDVFILFGGSGSEIILTKDLERNFVSCELNKEYYKMIQERIDRDGVIDIRYRQRFIQEKRGYLELEKMTEQRRLLESPRKKRKSARKA